MGGQMGGLGRGRAPLSPGVLAEHMRELVRLALPSMVQRVGILSLSLADTLMIANYNAQELAYQAIGLVPYMLVHMFALGLVMGTLVVVANAFGAGDEKACGTAWRRGVPYALGLGVIGGLFCINGEAVLLAFQQSPDLARGGGEVSRILGIALPFVLVTTVGNFFLEGIKRPVPPMVIMLFANVLNVLANWVLIYGVGPVPAMGAVGSALSTCIIAMTQACVISLYIWHFSGRERFGVRLKPEGGWKAWARQRTLGYAAGMSIGLENAAFTAMQAMAGVMGVAALGATQITFNAFAIPFMVSTGIGTAAAVRVGFYYGQRDRSAMTIAGWTALGFNTVVTTVLGLLLVAGAAVVAGAYTDDPAVFGYAAAMLAIIGLILPFDAAQTVMAGALRGMGETWVPTGLHLISYIFVMLPCAWWFSFEMEHGPVGLMEAFFVASVVSIGFIATRFHWLAKRGGAQGLAS